MPPPKDPIKYQQYIKLQSKSHMGQVSSRKGKKHRPDSIVLMKEAHKGQPSGFKGKKHTPEALALQRNAKLGNHYKLGKKNSPEGIENNRKAHLGLVSGFKGKKHTEESNQKNREKHLGKPSPRKGAILSEHTKRLVRKARAKQIFPLRDSKPERIMQIALALNGIKFKKHKSISDGNGFYHQVDIFIKPNICLEVDGDYWHTIPKVIERDNEVNKKLKELGYAVIRVKENVVKNDIQSWIEKALTTLKP